jgi:small-conductance mechanosensitive channel
VPNGDLISKELIKWTLSDPQRRVHLLVGVAYGSHAARVTEVLLEAAIAEPLVLGSPEPVVLFKGFGDSSLDFELLFWTLNETFLEAGSRLVTKVYAALRDAGIEIPFPQRDLHLRSLPGPSTRSAAPEPAPDPGSDDPGG